MQQLHNFDWYQCTVRHNFDDVGRAVQRAYGSDVVSVRNARAFNGYDHAAEIVHGEEALVKLQWGGVNPGTNLHATSYNARRFASVIRDLFPEHSVSRADVARDFAEEGAWDRLVGTETKPGAALAFALRNKVLDTNCIGDWVHGEKGRTLYIGSPKSPYRVRVYEKGKQQAAAGDPEADPNWVRVELQLRPPKADGKAALASKEPAECWGATKWTTSFSQVIDALNVARFETGTTHRETDDERSMRFLLKQYGPLLLRKLVENNLDPEKFGHYLRRQLLPHLYGIETDPHARGYQLDLPGFDPEFPPSVAPEPRPVSTFRIHPDNPDADGVLDRPIIVRDLLGDRIELPRT